MDLIGKYGLPWTNALDFVPLSILFSFRVFQQKKSIIPHKIIPMINLGVA